MNNSIHVVTEKYKFYEAKSIIRNSSEYHEKTVKKAEILVADYYKKNPHLLESVKKVSQEEIERIKLKYKIN
jgi:hypothetical protein